LDVLYCFTTITTERYAGGNLYEHIVGDEIAFSRILEHIAIRLDVGTDNAGNVNSYLLAKEFFKGVMV